VRQEIVREICRVVLLPGRPGKAFDPSTVRLLPGRWADHYAEGASWEAAVAELLG
jgi:hypothetical protein